MQTIQNDSAPHPLEVADIFRRYGDHYRQSHKTSYEQLKVMHYIEICRTSKLGGHVEQCDRYGFEHIAYNFWETVIRRGLTIFPQGGFFFQCLIDLLAQNRFWTRVVQG